MKYFIILLLMFGKLFGQVNLEPDHYFIYCLTDKKKGLRYELGQYGAKKTKLTKAEIYQDEEDFLKKINKKNYKGILVYIHGYQADNKHFEQTVGKFMHDSIFSPLKNEYDLIISLKWNSSLKYTSNFDLVKQKGRAFSKFIDTIYQSEKLQNQNLKLSFINHSMGNRVFEAMLLEKERQNLNWTIDKILLMAPDIENDIFHNTLKSIPSKVNAIHIFYNNDDKTLAMAKFVKPHERLGITGHDKPENLPANVVQHDITSINDEEGLTARMTRHRYFYSSPTVRKMINDILLED